MSDEQNIDRRLSERVAKLEANHDAIYDKLNDVVAELKRLTEFYSQSQGFAKGVQWLAGGILVALGWVISHFARGG